MSQKSDQFYLRLKNTSSDQLYFSDLDDEENKEQNKGVKVYIDPDEVIDIPMDADVMHSYEQGSIDGYVQQGRLEASPYQADTNELWVGPEGDDDNPGTRNSPLASIQTAIDRLDERVGSVDRKVIKVSPGIYQENLQINTRNLTVEGQVSSIQSQWSYEDPGVKIIDDDPSLPLVAIHTMTDSGYQNFRDDGGEDYIWNGGSYSYTGASLARDLRYDNTPRMKIHFEGILFEHQNPGSTKAENMLALGVPDPTSNNEGIVSDVTFEGCWFVGGSDTNIFLKNAQDFTFTGAHTRLISNVIFDTCVGIGFSSGGKKTRMLDSVIVVGDSTTDPDEGGVITEPNFFHPESPLEAGYFYELEIAGSVNLAPDIDVYTTPSLQTWNSFVWHSSGDIGMPSSGLDIDTQTFDVKGSGSAYLRQLECDKLQFTGSGTLDVDEIICADDATISSGSNHIVHSGIIQGDFIANSGTDVELRGVTIEGNLDVSGATTVTCKGCHIQGDVLQEDVSGSNVTIDGGSIMGSTPSSPSSATYNRNQGS
jgi:hypothetical protein